MQEICKKFAPYMHKYAKKIMQEYERLCDSKVISRALLEIVKDVN